MVAPSHARVSSHDQRGDIDRQVARLTESQRDVSCRSTKQSPRGAQSGRVVTVGAWRSAFGIDCRARRREVLEPPPAELPI